MKILALEFSSPQRSVAVLSSATGDMTAMTEVVESGGRSTKALGMIDEALRQTQIEREQIECVAVGLGPGSYTGIRAAISLAQGWQLACEVKLIGASSAEAVAAQAQSEGLRGRSAVVIDAQRNEFYIAEFDLSDSGWRGLRALRLATLAEVQTVGLAQPLIGPEVTRWFPDARVVFPRAAMLARMAQTRTEFVAGQQLEPIYLRQTQFAKAPPPRQMS
jgi:tRNA threonylcarbamoyl adenosine modification protein YeaZ